MELEQLRKSYKAKLDEIKALKATYADGLPTEEQEKKEDALLADAQKMAKQIDRENALKSLNEFGEQSQGSSVAGTYGRETLPGEGDIDGITANPETGEMLVAEKSALRAFGAEKLKVLKSGKYLDALDDYIRSEGLKRPMKGDAMKVLNEGQDTAGGFWIPPDYRNQLISKIATSTAMRPNATVVTTGRDVVTFPKVQYTTDDKYTSGVRFDWNASGPQAADQNESTNPVAGVLNIPVHLATASIIVQRAQLEDNGFDLLGFVTQKMQEAFGLGAEDAYINGDGTGKPQGLATHPTFGIAHGSTSTVAGETITGGYVVTGLSAGLTWQGISNDEPTKGILGIEAALPPQYEMNAKWYGNKAAYATVRSLVDANKRPLWQQSDGAFQSWVKGYPPTLLGYPINKSEFFAALAADSLSMYFGDMQAYYIVDRVALSVEVFRETLARRDQVLVYARMRTGGQLVDYWRMKALKAGTS